MMKKRMLSTLLALCMVLVLLPATALAANSDFQIENGVLVKYTGSGGAVTIPSGVTEIGPVAFAVCEGLTSVTIPGSVTSIGPEAFAACANLTSVTILNGVIEIGPDAFAGCDHMTSVTIPSSVTSIDEYAFGACWNLADIYYDGSESQWNELHYTLFEDMGLGDNIHFNSAGANTPAEPEEPGAPSDSDVPSTSTVGAVRSPQNLEVNGKRYDCEKYNIGGSNYFKLRDLAYILSGTGSQFGVGFDAATSTVTITTKMAYAPAGGELLVGVDNSATAQPSAQSILINGEAHSELTVYNIGGSNFFQLRELGSLLDFEVDYDADTNTAIVRSAQN